MKPLNVAASDRLRSIFSILLAALLFVCAAPAPAQQTAPPLDPIRLELNDGRVLYPKAMRRDKDTIIATLETPPQQPGGQPGQGDFGFALKDVAKLYYPKPAIIDAGPAMISTGRATAALTQIEKELKTFAGFRDAPGSWWDELVPLQIQALLAAKKDKEAISAADTFAALATTEENKLISRAFTAMARTRKGEHKAALPLYDEAYKATKRPDIQGLIAVNKGDSLVALADTLRTKGEVDEAARQYEAALLSYLRIPALYPSQKQYMPQCTLGAIRAYYGMDDFDRALTSINELRRDYPGTAEAEATTELEAKVRKRKEQLADPKTAAAESKPAS